MTRPNVDELRAAFVYMPETGIIRALDGRKVVQDSKGEYLAVNFDGRYYPAHLIIWAIVTGKYPEGTVDHKDLDGLNNRWVNLRDATEAQQQVNRRLFRNNSSGHRGVYQTASGKWQAQVRFDKKTHSLGTYESAEQAALVVQRARESRWGEFARNETMAA